MRSPKMTSSIVILGLLALIAGGLAAENDTIVFTPNDVPASGRQAREYYSSYYPSEEDNTKAKYPTTYSEYPPSNYVSYKEEMAPTNCPPSPIIPIFQNALSFLVLKLGALGIIKTIFAVVFIVFLLKLPIFLAKAAFFKAIFFPAFIAPLMLLFSNNMMMKDPNKNDNNNNNNNNNNPNNNNNNNNNIPNFGSSGRSSDDAMTAATWQSFRFLMDSERCAERFACQIGAYNNDTVSGASLSRMLKYIEHSSPAGARHRIRTLRDAFADGNNSGNCPAETYPCTTPHLMLAKGESTYRLL